MQNKFIASGSISIMFNITQQFQFLLKQVGVTLFNSLRALVPSAEGVYSDITDGTLYKTVCENLNLR